MPPPGVSEAENLNLNSNTLDGVLLGHTVLIVVFTLKKKISWEL